jgi:hypothetical protein
MKRFKLSLYLLSAFLTCPLPGTAEPLSPHADPAFNAQLVFSYGHGVPFTDTVALLHWGGMTNTSHLPGGTHEWFVDFKGHRHGKDVYTVGAKFPVGATNGTSFVKQVEYDGKRISVSLGEDTAVIEPR